MKSAEIRQRISQKIAFKENDSIEFTFDSSEYCPSKTFFQMLDKLHCYVCLKFLSFDSNELQKFMKYLKNCHSLEIVELEFSYNEENASEYVTLMQSMGLNNEDVKSISSMSRSVLSLGCLKLVNLLDTSSDTLLHLIANAKAQCIHFEETYIKDNYVGLTEALTTNSNVKCFVIDDQTLSASDAFLRIPPILCFHFCQLVVKEISAYLGLTRHVERKSSKTVFSHKSRQIQIISTSTVAGKLLREKMEKCLTAFDQRFWKASKSICD